MRISLDYFGETYFCDIILYYFLNFGEILSASGGRGVEGIFRGIRGVIDEGLGPGAGKGGLESGRGRVCVLGLRDFSSGLSLGGRCRGLRFFRKIF